MSEVVDHYENLLADHYTWMLGSDFDALVARQLTVLDSAGVRPADQGRTALDLGCGSGVQSIALARLGHDPVIGVDVSPTLLAELTARSVAFPMVRAVQADLCAGLDALVAPGTVQTVVCMGDTLTHLPDHASLQRLFVDTYAALRAGGVFVLTFRDLTVPLKGLDRFLPVRSDADRILTCFVEDDGPDAVRVHDLVHQRTAAGDWTLSTSSYRKLRLDPAWIVDRLTASGFDVDPVSSLPSGMTVIAARARSSA